MRRVRSVALLLLAGFSDVACIPPTWEGAGKSLVGAFL